MKNSQKTRLLGYYTYYTSKINTLRTYELAYYNLLLAYYKFVKKYKVLIIR